MINKKNCQILICHYSTVKCPEEDFKNILDEAERQRLKTKGCKEEKEPEDDSQRETKEPSSQSTDGSVASLSSSQRSSGSDMSGRMMPRKTGPRRQKP